MAESVYRCLFVYVLKKMDSDSDRYTRPSAAKHNVFSRIFKDPHRVLVLKLDCLLLVWMFVAGLTKVRDLALLVRP